MATDESDAKIVRSTVQLGRSLGLKVVAEGVEDQASWDAAARRSAATSPRATTSAGLRPPERLTPWLRTAASTSATGGLSAELTA